MTFVAVCVVHGMFLQLSERPIDALKTAGGCGLATIHDLPKELLRLFEFEVLAASLLVVQLEAPHQAPG